MTRAPAAREREYGHMHATGAGFCVDGWGAGPFKIMAGGKSFRFVDSDRFGPYLSDRHGDPTANPYPSERSPFWRAHRIWKYQGRRMTEDGVSAIWDEPKPEKVWRMSARSVFVVEPGEPDGEMIEATAEEVTAWRDNSARRTGGG